MQTQKLLWRQTVLKAWQHFFFLLLCVALWNINTNKWIWSMQGFEMLMVYVHEIWMFAEWCISVLTDHVPFDPLFRCSQHLGAGKSYITLLRQHLYEHEMLFSPRLNVSGLFEETCSHISCADCVKSESRYCITWLLRGHKVGQTGLCGADRTVHTWHDCGPHCPEPPRHQGPGEGLFGSLSFVEL